MRFTYPRSLAKPVHLLCETAEEADPITCRRAYPDFTHRVGKRISLHTSSDILASSETELKRRRLHNQKEEREGQISALKGGLTKC